MLPDDPILICYDGSEGAQHAIAAAGALLPGRTAVVLDIGPVPMVAESYAAFESDAVELDREVYLRAASQAEAGAELARAAGLRAVARGVVGAPDWRAVVEIADELGAAAIVVGPRGLSGIRERVEGLSHRVAEHAGRPVLIVPPPR
jgi:nucleotide-binding universal stress UspA family protein